MYKIPRSPFEEDVIQKSRNSTIYFLKRLKVSQLQDSEFSITFTEVYLNDYGEEDCFIIKHCSSSFCNDIKPYLPECFHVEVLDKKGLRIFVPHSYYLQDRSVVFSDWSPRCCLEFVSAVCFAVVIGWVLIFIRL